MYKKRLKEEVKNEIIYYKYHIGVKNQINIFRKLINISIKLNH